ncbi:MAG: flagellar biosynthetic protein FliO [Lysobacteraceae bacterium]
MTSIPSTQPCRRCTAGVRTLLAAGLLLGPGALAAAPVPPGDTTFVRELLGLLLPLAFVIVLLVVVLMLFRRRLVPRGGRNDLLRIEQVLPVGPRDRLVLVAAPGGRRLLVGIGAGSPRLVAELQGTDGETGEPRTREESPPAS